MPGGTINRKTTERAGDPATLSARVARGLAGKFIFLNLRDRYAAGDPQLVVDQPSGPFWLVPILLMPAGKHARLVGELKLNGITGEVIGHTIPAEILSRAQAHS